MCLSCHSSSLYKAERLKEKIYRAGKKETEGTEKSAEGKGKSTERKGGRHVISPKKENVNVNVPANCGDDTSNGSRVGSDKVSQRFSSPGSLK